MSETDEKTIEEENAEETKAGISALLTGIDYHIEVAKPEENKEETPEKEPEVEEPVAEEKPEEEEKPVVEEITEIQRLQEQIVELTKNLNKEEEPEEEVEKVVSPFSFTDEELEDAMDSTGNLRELLTKMATQISEHTLQNIPAVVSATVSRQTAVRDILVKFWGDHPKLGESNETKEFVKYNIRQVEGEHPDWNYEKVLNESAIRAYKMMGIKLEAREREQERRDEITPVVPDEPVSDVSTFAKKPGGKSALRRPVSDDRSSEQKSIAKMIADVT